MYLAVSKFLLSSIRSHYDSFETYMKSQGSKWLLQSFALDELTFSQFRYQTVTHPSLQIVKFQHKRFNSVWDVLAGCLFIMDQSRFIFLDNITVILIFEFVHGYTRESCLVSKLVVDDLWYFYSAMKHLQFHQESFRVFDFFQIVIIRWTTDFPFNKI